MKTQRIGGIAALIEAATFVVGFAVVPLVLTLHERLKTTAPAMARRPPPSASSGPGWCWPPG